MLTKVKYRRHDLAVTQRSNRSNPVVRSSGTLNGDSMLNDGYAEVTKQLVNYR